MQQEKNRTLFYRTVSTILIALGIAAVFFSFLFRGVILGEGKTVIYHIPAHFSGWMVIKFGVPSCPPLKEDKEAIHVRVGKDGEVCTSDPLFEGWKKVKYLQTTKDGAEETLPYGSWDKSKDRIWPVTLGYVSYTREGKSYTVPRELFFVGTKEQLERAWGNQPSLQ